MIINGFYHVERSYLFNCIVLGLMFPIVTFSLEMLEKAPYSVCFTPGENCTQLIVNQIDAA